MSTPKFSAPMARPWPTVSSHSVSSAVVPNGSNSGSQRRRSWLGCSGEIAALADVAELADMMGSLVLLWVNADADTGTNHFLTGDSRRSCSQTLRSSAEMLSGMRRCRRR